MNKFTLKNVKRKLPENKAFSTTDESDEDEESFRKKQASTNKVLLEDNLAKSDRLCNEGIILAEAERYREAIRR